MSSPLTHFDAAGQAHMVDVGAKDETVRVALAAGSIRMQPGTLQLVTDGTAKKGDVLGVARIAGIMAAKRTSELIPLCHPIALTRVTVEFELLEAGAERRHYAAPPATQSPDLPPCFSSRRTSVMVMPRSTALHMS